MIHFEQCSMTNIVIHHVGNKFEGETLTLSDKCFLPTDTDVLELLKSYFLSSFKKEAYYHFIPYENLLMNNFKNKNLPHCGRFFVIILYKAKQIQFPKNRF